MQELTITWLHNESALKSRVFILAHVDLCDVIFSGTSNSEGVLACLDTHDIDYILN